MEFSSNNVVFMFSCHNENSELSQNYTNDLFW